MASIDMRRKLRALEAKRDNELMKKQSSVANLARIRAEIKQLRGVRRARS